MTVSNVGLEGVLPGGTGLHTVTRLESAWAEGNQDCCNWLCDLTKRNTEEWILMDFGYALIPLRIMPYHDICTYT